jgi:hypothetical protein
VLTYQQTGQAPLFFSGELTPGQFVGFILFTQRFIWPMAQFVPESSVPIPNYFATPTHVHDDAEDCTRPLRQGA